MLLTFLWKWLLLNLIIGWPLVLLVFIDGSWLTAAACILFEMCLGGLAYFAAGADVWWRTRGPGLWER